MAKMTTAKLLKALSQGAKIVTPSAPYAGRIMVHSPRSPRDNRPWRMEQDTEGLFRFSATELNIEWGPDGKPVQLTENQAYIVELIVERGDWYPGCGWHWSNRSTTIQKLDALVRKGVMIRTSDVPYQERYALSDLGHRQFNKSQGMPTEAEVKTVLVMLAEQSGEWKPGCGWWYRNQFLTKLCLTLLVRQGLVVRNGDSFGLKGEGFDAAREAGFDPNLLGEDV